MPLTLLPFLFLIVPMAEIATFIVVGSHIGVLPTIALVIATAVTGATLLRVQGIGTFSRIREKMERGEVPGRDLVHGLMIMVAGVLLLMPGFLTDILGILLFVPPIRDAVWRLLRDRVVMSIRTRASSGGRSPGGRTIDLNSSDFSRTDRPKLD